MGHQMDIGNEVTSVDQSEGNSVTEEGAIMDEGGELGHRTTHSSVLCQGKWAEESTTGHQVEGEGRHQH
jgi:hypothetical protein